MDEACQQKSASIPELLVRTYKISGITSVDNLRRDVDDDDDDVKHINLSAYEVGG